MTAIELAGVSRWFGNVVAVNDVTMTIGPGVTGLLGPNGAGKTTLLSMMSGFLRAVGGHRRRSTARRSGATPRRTDASASCRRRRRCTTG